MFFTKVTDYLISLGEEAENYEEIKVSLSKKTTDFINENLIPLYTR